MGDVDASERAYSELTEKQREALNLLIQHKTSKEISRILGVSPHTVDQRIESSKRKFGVATRGELAQAYQRAIPMGQRLTYENLYIVDPGLADETSKSELQGRTQAQPDPFPSGQDETIHRARGYQVLPEPFSGPSGTLYRLAAIVILAVLLVMIVLGGISIFVTLTEILKR